MNDNFGPIAADHRMATTVIRDALLEFYPGMRDINRVEQFAVAILVRLASNNPPLLLSRVVEEEA